MPQAKNPCGWQDCKRSATTEVHLDAGSSTCSECGQDITNRRTFKLCDEHMDEYGASGDVTMLLLSAKEA